MSLAQMPGFSPKKPSWQKMAVDMPAFELRAAEAYEVVLRDKFNKANKKEKREMYELVSVAVHNLMMAASDRSRKQYGKLERSNFLKIAMIYQRLKQDFGKVVLG